MAVSKTEYILIVLFFLNLNATWLSCSVKHEFLTIIKINLNTVSFSLLAFVQHGWNWIIRCLFVFDRWELVPYLT